MIGKFLLASLVLSACAWAQGGFGGPGRYEIRNLKSGKVLDLDRNDQSTVIQFESRGTDNQTWEIRPAGEGFFYVRNAMNGNALTATGGGNGTPVQGLRFNGEPNQQWRFEPGKDGNLIIRNRVGKVLDVPDGTSRDGARINLFDENGDSNQRFIFSRLQGGFGRWGGGGWDDPDRCGGGVLLTCSSDDGHRHYCLANTGNGVRMTRQISGSACEQGRTWGYDQRGVWVDRGCRAEFEIGGGGGDRDRERRDRERDRRE